MSKPTLDMVEFSFPASDLKDMNENLFVRQTLFDEVTGSVIQDCSYLNLQGMHYGSKPLGIKHIKIDRIRNRVSIIITSKILLELYAKLITAETIKRALENLINHGFISFNPDVVIYLSNVHSFDLTKDIPLSMPAEDYIRDLRILGTVHNYRIKNYKTGVDVYSEAQSNKHRMIIYQKYAELCSNNVTNRKLLKYVDKEHFKNTLRIEANFKNEAIIKKYFQIRDDEEIMLSKILNYEENVLYNYFNEMWSELKMKKSLKSVWVEDFSPAELAKKIGMREIIQVCQYNRDNINKFIKTKLKGKQILKPETVAQILTPQDVKNPPESSRWSKIDMGLTWWLRESKSERYFSHGGSGSGVTTFAFFDPKKKVGAIFFVTGDWHDKHYDAIFFDLLRKYI